MIGCFAVECSAVIGNPYSGQPVFSDGVDVDVDYSQAMAVLIPAAEQT